MAALSLSVDGLKSLNRWDYSSIRPGPVGSVGDALITPRLKSSLPGDFRWETDYYGNNESLYGSSITDGAKQSYNSGGGPARTLDTNWGSRRRFKTRYGYIFQNIHPPDKRVEPEVGELPQYSWRNKVARVDNLQKTGDLFKRTSGLVGNPNGPTRGGQFPRVTDVVGEMGLEPYQDKENVAAVPRVALSNMIHQPVNLNGQRHDRLVAGRIARDFP